GGPVPTNPNPMAATHAPTDLDIAAASFMKIDYQNDIGPIVAAKCVSCHQPVITGTDTTAAAGNLDLTAAPDTVRGNRIFPRGYVNLSGEMMMGSTSPIVVVPPFPRRSLLIDYVLGLGAHAGLGSHPAG